MTSNKDSEAQGFWTRDFSPIQDTLIGENDGDNFRHVIVRDTFIHELWNYDMTQGLLQIWADSMGLKASALHMANSMRRWDSAIRTSGDESLSPDTVGGNSGLQVQDAEAEYLDAMEEFQQRRRLVISSNYLGWHAEWFVRRKLRLPYPWVALDLVERFIYMISGIAQGRIYRFTGRYEPQPLSEITAPLIKATLQTFEGESVGEAKQRFERQYGELLEKLDEPVLPRGKVPKRTINSLKQYARWYFRHRVKRESIRAITMSEHKDMDGRKEIKDGIKRVEELLALNPYTWKIPPAS